MVNRKLLFAQQEELYKLYLSGVKKKDLAVMYGVSAGTVTNVIYRMDNRDHKFLLRRVQEIAQKVSVVVEDIQKLKTHVPDRSTTDILKKHFATIRSGLDALCEFGEEEFVEELDD